MILVGMKGWECLDANCAMFSDMTTGVIAGVSVFLALLFGLFVAVMFFD